MVVIAPSPRSARRKTVSTSTSAAQQVPEIQFAAKKRALSGGQPGLPRSILKPYNFNGGNDSANGSTGILGRADQSTGSVGSRKSSGRRLTFATEANIREFDRRKSIFAPDADESASDMSFDANTSLNQAADSGSESDSEPDEPADGVPVEADHTGSFKPTASRRSTGGRRSLGRDRNDDDEESGGEEDMEIDNDDERAQTVRRVSRGAGDADGEEDMSLDDTTNFRGAILSQSRSSTTAGRRSSARLRKSSASREYKVPLGHGIRRPSAAILALEQVTHGGSVVVPGSDDEDEAPLHLYPQTNASGHEDDSLDGPDDEDEDQGNQTLNLTELSRRGSIKSDMPAATPRSQVPGDTSRRTSTRSDMSLASSRSEPDTSRRESSRSELSDMSLDIPSDDLPAATTPPPVTPPPLIFALPTVPAPAPPSQNAIAKPAVTSAIPRPAKSGGFRPVSSMRQATSSTVDTAAKKSPTKPKFTAAFAPKTQSPRKRPGDVLDSPAKRQVVGDTASSRRAVSVPIDLPSSPSKSPGRPHVQRPPERRASSVGRKSPGVSGAEPQSESIPAPSTPTFAPNLPSLPTRSSAQLSENAIPLLRPSSQQLSENRIPSPREPSPEEEATTVTPTRTTRASISTTPRTSSPLAEVPEESSSPAPDSTHHIITYQSFRAGERARPRGLSMIPELPTPTASARTSLMYPSLGDALSSPIISPGRRDSTVGQLSKSRLQLFASPGPSGPSPQPDPEGGFSLAEQLARLSTQDRDPQTWARSVTGPSPALPEVEEEPEEELEQELEDEPELEPEAEVEDDAEEDEEADVEEESPEPVDPPMTLAEFFTETGVKFMDDFTCPRYSMAAGLGDEILAGAESPELSEYHRALAVDLPFLEDFNWLAETVKTTATTFQTIVKDADAAVNEDPPEVFRAYRDMEDAERSHVQYDLTQLKTFCVATARAEWYELRSDTTRRLQERLDERLEALDADEQTLISRMAEMDRELPALEPHRARLVASFKTEQAAIREVEDCDQEYLAELKQAMTEQQVQLDAVQAQLADQEAEQSARSEKLAIQQSERTALQQQVEEAQRHLHVKNSHTSKHIVADLQALELLGAVHGWTVQRVRQNLVRVTHIDGFALVIPCRNWTAVVGSIRFERVAAHRAAKGSTSKKDRFPVATTYLLRAAERLVNAWVSTDANSRSYAHVIRLVEPLWNSLSHLRREIDLLAIRFPVRLFLSEDGTQMCIAATVLVPAHKTKTVVNFVFDEAAAARWPHSASGVKVQVVVSYGSVQTSSVEDAVRQYLNEASVNDAEGHLNAACLDVQQISA